MSAEAGPDLALGEMAVAGLPCSFNCEGRLRRINAKEKDLFKRYFKFEDHHLGADTVYCRLLTWARDEKIDFRLLRVKGSPFDTDLYFKSDADAMAFKLRWL